MMLAGCSFCSFLIFTLAREAAATPAVPFPDRRNAGKPVGGDSVRIDNAANAATRHLSGDAFGAALATFGDKLLIGAPFDYSASSSDTSRRSGAIHEIKLASDGSPMASSLGKLAESPSVFSRGLITSDDEAGYAVAYLADGVAVMGMPEYQPVIGGNSHGAIAVVEVGSRLQQSATYAFKALQSRAGQAVASLGNLDDDISTVEIAVLADAPDGTASSRPSSASAEPEPQMAVHIHSISVQEPFSISAAKATHIFAQRSTEEFGMDIITLGDLDLDGQTLEVAVSSTAIQQSEGDGGSDGGYHLFSVDSALQRTRSVKVPLLVGRGYKAGYGVAFLGDINSDGISGEVAVGSEGAGGSGMLSIVFHRRDLAVFHRIDINAADLVKPFSPINFGRSLANFGAGLDGEDGSIALAVGDVGEGNGYVFVLELQRTEYVAGVQIATAAASVSATGSCASQSGAAGVSSTSPCGRMLYSSHDTILMAAPGAAPAGDVVKLDQPFVSILTSSPTDLLASNDQLVRIDLQPAAIASSGVLGVPPRGDPAQSWRMDDYAQVWLNQERCIISSLDRAEGRIWCAPLTPRMLSGWARVRVRFWNGVWSNSSQTEVHATGGDSSSHACSNSADVPCVMMGPLVLYRDNTQRFQIPALRRSGGQSLQMKSIGVVHRGFDQSWPSQFELRIGPFLCQHPAVVFPSAAQLENDANVDEATIKCPSLPEGSGGPHHITVKVLGGYEVLLRESFHGSLTRLATNIEAVPTVVEYQPPVVSGILPSSEIAERDGNVSITVVGDDFGSSIASIDSVWVGGIQCGQVEYISQQQLKCNHLQANAFPTRDVEVRMKGSATNNEGRNYVSSVGGESLLQVPAAPTVVGAQPAVIPAVGAAVTLFGPNLDDPLDWIKVGDALCSPLTPDTEFSVVCGVPAGAGKDLHVTVRSAIGREATSLLGLISFNPPRLDSVMISPTPVYSGPDVTYSAVLYGEHFGSASRSDLAIFVGDRPCIPTLTGPRNDTAVSCSGLTAPWTSNDVQIVVGGQSATLFGAFQYQEPTSVEIVSPVVLPTAGGSITVQGEGFGNSQLGISVFIGHLQAMNVQPTLDGKSLTCIVPPGTGYLLDVVVTTTQNGASARGSARLSFQPPEVVWVAVAGSRSEDLLQDSSILSIRRLRSVLYLGENAVRMEAGIRNAGTSVENLEQLRLAGNGFTLHASNVSAIEIDAATGELQRISFIVDLSGTSNHSVLPDDATVDQRSQGRSWPVLLQFEVAQQEATSGVDLLQALDYPIDGWSRSIQSPTAPLPQAATWILGPPVLASMRPSSIPTAGSIDMQQMAPNSTSLDMMLHALGIEGLAAVADGTQGASAEHSIVRSLKDVQVATSDPTISSSKLIDMGMAQVQGGGFGHAPWALHSVSIGASLCPVVIWSSPSELLLIVPPGIGRDRRVSVRTIANKTDPVVLDGTSSRSVQLQVSYLAPQVNTVWMAATVWSGSERSVAYLGEQNAVIRATVANAGISVSSWTSLRLKSQRWELPCIGVSVRETYRGQISTVQCTTSLDATQRPVDGSNDTLEDLVPLGTSHQVSLAFEVAGVSSRDPLWSLAQQSPANEPSASTTRFSPSTLAWVVGRPLVVQVQPSVIATEGMRGNRIDSDEFAGGVAAQTDLVIQLRSAIDSYLDRMTASPGALASVVELDDLLPNVYRQTSTDDLVSAGLVSFRGAGFGHTAAALLSASINGIGQCPIVVWISQTSIACVPPTGTGSGRDIVVVTGGNLASSGTTLSYSPPQVSEMAPSYGLVGPNHFSSFTISGRHFGQNSQMLERIIVGGRQCSQAVHRGPNRVLCIDAPSDSWFSRRTVVVIDGQESFPNALFEPLDPPVVRAVSPSIAKVGQTILVLGSNFGEVANDVTRVTIAGEDCNGLQHEGPTALTCDMPVPPQALVDRANQDIASLRDLPVVVYSAGGVASIANGNATITFATLGTPLTEAPENLLTWRVAGRADRLVMRWSFVDLDYDATGVEPVASFDIETWAASPVTGEYNGENTSAHTPEEGLTASPSSIITQQQVRRADVTEQRTSDGVLVFRYSVPALQSTPLRVRLRGFSDAGPGPWSQWTAAVPATCVEGEYLDTSVVMGLWECKPCDNSVVQCDGSVSYLVGAAPGFQRLSWTGNSISFAQCPMGAETCLGGRTRHAPQQLLANASSELTARQLQASTIIQLPSLQEALDQDKPASSGGAGASYDPSAGSAALPWETEQCADGYAGVLCASCQPGYTRWGSYECRRCARKAYVALAACGVGLLIVVGIVALSAQALKRGSEEEKEIIERAVRAWKRRMKKKVRSLGRGKTSQYSKSSGGSTQVQSREEEQGQQSLQQSKDLPERDQAASSRLHLTNDQSDESLPVSSTRRDALIRQATERFDDRSSESIGVAVIKIAFSHLQTVAIASQFDLEWPQSLVDMFTAFSTTSSAASDVISLECMLNSVSSETSSAPDAGGEQGEQSRTSFILTAAANATSMLLPNEWPHPTAADVGVLRNAERNHALAIASPPISSSWLVDAMPGGSSYFASQLVILAFPLLLAVFIAALWFFLEALDGWLYMPRDQKTGEPDAVAQDDSNDRPKDATLQHRSPCFGIMADERRTSSVLMKLPFLGVPVQAARLPYLSKVVVTLIVVGFILHITVTDAALGLLTCTDVQASFTLGNDGDGDERGIGLVGCPAGTEHRRYVRDLNVCCYDPKALAFTFGLGIPGVLVYAIGIPIAALALLLQYKDDMHKPQTRALLSFLRAGFRRDVLYWEVVIMLRKFAISAVVVFLEPFGVRIQTYASLAILFAVTVAHVHQQPYSHKRLNNLEFAVLCSAFATFEAGLFLHDSSSGDETRVTATAVVIGSNALVLSWAAFIAAKDLLPGAWSTLMAKLGFGVAAGAAGGTVARQEVAAQSTNATGQAQHDPTVAGAILGACCGCCGCAAAFLSGKRGRTKGKRERRRQSGARSIGASSRAAAIRRARQQAKAKRQIAAARRNAGPGVGRGPVGNAKAAGGARQALRHVVEQEPGSDISGSGSGSSYSFGSSESDEGFDDVATGPRGGASSAEVV